MGKSCGGTPAKFEGVLKASDHEKVRITGIGFKGPNGIYERERDATQPGHPPRYRHVEGGYVLYYNSHWSVETEELFKRLGEGPGELLTSYAVKPDGFEEQFVQHEWIPTTGPWMIRNDATRQRLAGWVRPSPEQIENVKFYWID